MFEQAEMVGNGRSAHVDRIGNVVDADFAVAEQPEDAQAGGVADELESFRCPFKRLCIRHIDHDVFDFFAMVAMWLQFF